MNARHAIRFVLIALLVAAPWAAPRLSAASSTVELPTGIDMDEAGRMLRQAINAWESARENPLPVSWTSARLLQGESLRLGPDHFLLYVAPASGGDELLFVDASGPSRAVCATGREVALGALQVIVANRDPSSRVINVLLRGSDSAPALLARQPGTSQVRITGISPSPSDARARIIVESPNERAVFFAEEFLNRYTAGQSAEQAARGARERVPPASIHNESFFVPPPGRDYTDPRNMFLEDDPYDVTSVAVTLRVVRGDSESIRSLESAWAYDSAGRRTDSPRVQAEGGGRGADVRIGDPGDAVRARIRALEAEGRLRMESETLVRVPFGGSSRFSVFSFDRQMAATVFARRQGRDRAMLLFDHFEGDWSHVGSMGSRLLIRDGQTIVAASNTARRVESSSGGVPILQDLPYIGPAFGNENRRERESTFALIVTARFD